MPFIAFTAVAASGEALCSITPERLRCEYLADPIGIGVAVPRLSWKLQARDPQTHDLGQSGYRVLVAASKDSLDRDKGDLWDSGKVQSDESACIEYAGKPLRSRLACWWKVRVWDRDGKASDWSKSATWSMGLLDPTDWSAKWIGYDRPADAKTDGPDLEGAKWIWFAGEEKTAPVGKRYFRKTFQVPDGSAVDQAELMMSADDQFVVKINGKVVAQSDGETDAWRRPAFAQIEKELKPGENLMEVEAENTSSGAAGLIAKLKISLSNLSTVTVVTDGEWLCGKESQKATENAGVVAAYGASPWGRLAGKNLVLPPPRLLRREFQVAKPIKCATAYCSALGLYELRVNGKKASDDLFMPGWTDYAKRVYYRSYDVTKLLTRGANAVGAILGDGWYAGYVGFGNRREHYGRYTRFLGQIEVEYTDGTTETIATSPDWKAKTGPILESDFLMGERYDARKELDGWDRPAYNENGWRKVDVADEIGAEVEAFPSHPVRPYAELKAKKITEPKKGVYVLDLGQNMAGFARLKIKGDKGQKITLRFAERLNPDGTVYTINLRTARATDVYVCKGDGIEIWEPRFTFHGFQYIEVTGLGRQPGKDEVVGIAVSSADPDSGKFQCSDAMVNKLWSNAWWTQKMNFIDIPTDCPQRDERLGWTGDAQAYIRTACMNTDVQPFFTKWLTTLDDAQRADGQFPMVAPVKVAGSDGGPAWADAGVICPWTVYDVYGDKRQLAQHYPAMRRFVEFCRARCTPDLLPPAEFHCFGDWLSIDAPTPNQVIFTAYFAYSTHLTAEAARALGKAEDAAAYDDLFAKVKAAFNKAYVDDDGRIQGDTQCDYVLALAFDLLDGERIDQAAKHLVADIEKRGWHLSTGFVGTKDLMLVLAKIGRNDVAYRLLHNTTFPSWGFTIKNGATSIWERWNGWTPETGFADPGMNSFAHYAFGAVVQWMYEEIGGIHASKPGYREFVLKPQPGGKLTWARTSYDSINGEIVCEWRIEGQTLKIKAIVPPNTKASVYVPSSKPGSVRSKLKPSSLLAGAAVYEVGSGTYEFEAPR